MSSKINLNKFNIENVNLDHINNNKTNILFVMCCERSKILDKIIDFSNNIKNSYVYIIEPYFIWKNKHDIIIKNFSNIFTCQYNICNSSKIIWIPGYNFLFDFNKFNNLENYNFIRNDINLKRKLVCSSPISSSFSEIREKIVIDFVSNGLNIEIYGKNPILNTCCKNNVISSFDKKFKGNYGFLSKDKANIFSNYKFIIVIENNFVSGCFSEKLIDCFLSLSVPIYFGALNAEYFFPDLFNNAVINGLNFNNTNEIIELIKNMSDDEYNLRIENIKKLRNKYFNITSFNYVFNYMSDYILKDINKNYSCGEYFFDRINNNKKKLDEISNFNLNNLKFTCLNCKEKFKKRKTFTKHLWSCK